MKHFDTSNDGRISYSEFVNAITGDIAPEHQEILKKKWEQIEAKNGTKIDAKILKKYYDPSCHPDVNE